MLLEGKHVIMKKAYLILGIGLFIYLSYLSKLSDPY